MFAAIRNFVIMLAEGFTFFASAFRGIGMMADDEVKRTAAKRQADNETLID